MYNKKEEENIKKVFSSRQEYWCTASGVRGGAPG